MSNKLFEIQKRLCAIVNAAVLNDPSDMVRQMALPLIAQRRVKGALEYVSRDSGLTYSKTRRLFYGLVRDIWSQEKKSLTEAFKRFAINQERLHREQAERLASILAECEALERQYGMDLQIDPRVVGQAYRPDTPNAR